MNKLAIFACLVFLSSIAIVIPRETTATETNAYQPETAKLKLIKVVKMVDAELNSGNFAEISSFKNELWGVEFNVHDGWQYVSRINPKTGEVVKRFLAPNKTANGVSTLGIWGRTAWVIDSDIGSIYRLDTSNGQVKAEYDIGTVITSPRGGTTDSKGHLWILDTSLTGRSRVVDFDPAKGMVKKAIELKIDFFGHDIAIDSKGSLYITVDILFSRNLLLKVDGKKGTLLKKYLLGEYESGVAILGNNLVTADPQQGKYRFYRMPK